MRKVLFFILFLLPFFVDAQTIHGDEKISEQKKIKMISGDTITLISYEEYCERRNIRHYPMFITSSYVDTHPIQSPSSTYFQCMGTGNITLEEAQFFFTKKSIDRKAGDYFKKLNYLKAN